MDTAKGHVYTGKLSAASENFFGVSIPRWTWKNFEEFLKKIFLAGCTSNFLNQSASKKSNYCRASLQLQNELYFMGGCPYGNTRKNSRGLFTSKIFEKIEFSQVDLFALKPVPIDASRWTEQEYVKILGQGPLGTLKNSIFQKSPIPRILTHSKN